MKRIIIAGAFMFISLFLASTPVQAKTPECNGRLTPTVINYNPNRDSITFTYDGGNLESTSTYQLEVGDFTDGAIGENMQVITLIKGNNDTYTATYDFLPNKTLGFKTKDWKGFATVVKKNPRQEICFSKITTNLSNLTVGCTLIISQDGAKNRACYDNDTDISIKSDDVTVNNGPLNGDITIEPFFGAILSPVVDGKLLTHSSNGPLTIGPHTIKVKHDLKVVCQKTIAIEDYCSPEDSKEDSGKDSYMVQDFTLCGNISDEVQQGKCTECEPDGVWTGLGCIKIDPTALITQILQISLSMAGGIGLLLIVYGGFQISVSAGDPKKAQAGKEMITSTIAGLIFIIFSAFLLKFIGVNIFALPGF